MKKMRTVSTCSLVFFPISTMQGNAFETSAKNSVGFVYGQLGWGSFCFKPFAINESAKAVAVLLSEIPQNVRC